MNKKSHMFPRNTSQDIIDVGVRDNGEHLCQSSTPNPFFSMQSPHFKHYFSAQFCEMLTFAARHAAFLASILQVSFTCAQKQVSRIAARGIVAFVTDQPVARIFTVGQIIRNAMSAKSSSSGVKNKERAISVGTGFWLPYPALIIARYGNIAPKAGLVLLAQFKGFIIRMGHFQPPNRLNGSRLGRMFFAFC